MYRTEEQTHNRRPKDWNNVIHCSFALTTSSVQAGWSQVKTTAANDKIRSFRKVDKLEKKKNYIQITFAYKAYNEV